MIIHILLLTTIGLVLGLVLHKLQTALNELENTSDSESNVIIISFLALVPIFLIINYFLYDFTITFFISSFLSTILLTESISDIKYGIVLDSLIVVGLIIMIPYKIIEGEFIIHLIGALIVFAMLYLIALYFYKRTGEISLGGGDIKLYFLIGFFLNPIPLIISLNIMSIIALIYGLIRNAITDKIEIRLVPFIFCATMLTFYLENAIIELIN